MGRLNPYALVQKKVAKDVEAKRKAARKERFDQSRGVSGNAAPFRYNYAPVLTRGWLVALFTALCCNSLLY